jgi:hypothetical protein
MENESLLVAKTELPKQESSAAGWCLGGLSFIPLIGVPFGIITIIIGIVKKNKGQIFLGIGGIIWTIVLYSALFYFGFVANFGPYADLKIGLTSQIINSDAGYISLYEQKYNKFPEKITDVIPSDTNMFSLTDPWFTPLLFKPINDKSFEIRSAGPDKIINTDDDISKTF